MKTQKSAEDYLETILILSQREGRVRSVDIANEMNFTKPSVSNAMKKLREKRHITVDPLGGMLPGVLAASVMGASLSDPASPAFIGSLVASLLIAGGSVLLYRRVMRRNSQGEVPQN